MSHPKEPQPFAGENWQSEWTENRPARPGELHRDPQAALDAMTGPLLRAEENMTAHAEIAAEEIQRYHTHLREDPRTETAAALLTAARIAKDFTTQAIEQQVGRLKKTIRTVQEARGTAAEHLRCSYEPELQARAERGEDPKEQLRYDQDPGKPKVIASLYLQRDFRVENQDELPESLKSPDPAKIRQYIKEHGHAPPGVRQTHQFIAKAPASSGKPLKR